MSKFLPLPAPYEKFEVSDDARIRRVGSLRELKPARCSDGYVRIPLRIARNTVKTFHLHRLVALVHVPGDVTLTVNHKDGVKHNNQAPNLEWVTLSENHLHSFRVLGRKAAASRKLAVASIDLATLEIQEFSSGRAAAICLGDPRRAANIKHAIDQGTTAYGRCWSYASEIKQLTKRAAAHVV